MEYSVVGNNNYLITDKKEIERKDGNTIGLKIKNGKVTIDIYGYIKNVDIEWLYWLSYFKLEMPKGYEDRVFDLEFKDYFSLKHMKVDTKMVVFKTPVYLKTDSNYRLIARFPNYAISTKGVVYNIHGDTYNKPRFYNFNGKPHYNKSTVIDQASRYKSKEQLTHRLVAITWIENDDFEKHYLVDHKDGDKTNCHYTNLKWTDHKGNNQDKVYQGLSSQAIAVRVRNIKTGLVKTFPSLGTACKFMGRSPIDTNYTPLKPTKIWEAPKGRFEIKYASDDTAWYFANKDNIYTKNQKVSIRITKEDGSLIVASSLPDLLTKVFDGKKVADTVGKAILIYKKRFPKDKVELNMLDQYIKDSSYIAKNIVTGETFTTDSRKELIAKTSVSKSSIQKSISYHGAYQYKNWVFKLDDQQPFKDVTNQASYNPSSEIKVLDTSINQELDFKSLREASNHLNIDRKTLSTFISNQNLLYNKYLISVRST